MTTLDSIREQIDEVDRQIVVLLEKRVGLAREVARIKRGVGQAPLTDKAREDKIITRLQTLITDPILKDALGDIYSRLFSLSKIVRHLSQHPVCPYEAIGIIGDGLIGRSLYKVIHGKSGDSVAVTIHGRGWEIDQFRNCELIIIATPIDDVISVARTLAENAHIFKKGMIVIDVASVKESIARVFADLDNLSKGRIHFIPTHPMGGKQEQGSKSSQMTLFAGRPWIMCAPEKKVKDATVKILTSFIEYCGSHVIILDPHKHDCLVSYISHFPGLLSKALSDFVTMQSIDSLALAGSGFDLMTKIGKTENLRMRSQISNHNKDNIQHTMDSFVQFLQKGGTEWTL